MPKKITRDDCKNVVHHLHSIHGLISAGRGFPMTAVSEVRIRRLRDGNYEIELMQGPTEALTRFQNDWVSAADGLKIVTRIQQTLWELQREHDDAINAILEG